METRLNELHMLLEELEDEINFTEKEINSLDEIGYYEEAQEHKEGLDELEYELEGVKEEIEAIHIRRREGNPNTLEYVGMSQSDFI